MSSHPWCSDVQRDTAIRAAEDAAASERPPLPEWRDLPERMAALEAVVFGRSPAARTDETSPSGLRTERVTLEIVHDASNDNPLLIGGAERIAYAAVEREFRYPGESVRVVPSDEADAEVEIWKSLHGAAASGREFERLGKEKAEAERDAALARVAELQRQLAQVAHSRSFNVEKTSTGVRVCYGYHDKDKGCEWEEFVPAARVAELQSQLSRSGKNAPSDGDSDAKCTERESSADAEPVADAWGVVRDGEVKMVALRWYRAAVVCSASQSGGTVVPLFRAAPRGWLTAEERKAVEYFSRFCDTNVVPTDWDKMAAQLRSLLSRNSPPMVRLPGDPDCSTVADYGRAWRECVDAVRAALKEAGVEVGE